MLHLFNIYIYMSAGAYMRAYIYFLSRILNQGTATSIKVPQKAVQCESTTLE